MINDTLPRRELNRRLQSILAELEDLLDNKMGFLPFDQVGRFFKLTKEFRAFVKTNEHDHD